MFLHESQQLLIRIVRPRSFKKVGTLLSWPKPTIGPLAADCSAGTPLFHVGTHALALKEQRDAEFCVGASCEGGRMGKEAIVDFEYRSKGPGHHPPGFCCWCLSVVNDPSTSGARKRRSGPVFWDAGGKVFSCTDYFNHRSGFWIYHVRGRENSVKTRRDGNCAYSRQSGNNHKRPPECALDSLISALLKRTVHRRFENLAEGSAITKAADFEQAVLYFRQIPPLKCAKPISLNIRRVLSE